MCARLCVCAGGGRGEVKFHSRRVCSCVCAPAYVSVCEFLRMRARTCMYVCVCVCVFLSVCLSVSISVSVSVCLHVSMFKYVNLILEEIKLNSSLS